MPNILGNWKILILILFRISNWFLLGRFASTSRFKFWHLNTYDRFWCDSREVVLKRDTNADALNAFSVAFEDNARPLPLARSPSTLLRAGHSALLRVDRARSVHQR